MAPMNYLLFILFCTVFSTAFADEGTIKRNSDREIELLIKAVDTSECIFHRNGKTYPAEKGADHLRLKLRRGAKYAKTTENFIENLASSSSWSGKPYEIECTKGESLPMKNWLGDQLNKIRNDAK